MKIRNARPADLDALLGIYAAARRYMAENGNPTQWADGRPYPDELTHAIEQGSCLVGVDENDAPHFAFMLFAEPDPTYETIYEGSWPNDAPYVTIHRVASDGTGHGVFASIVAYAREHAEALGLHDHAAPHRQGGVLLLWHHPPGRRRPPPGLPSLVLERSAHA